MTLTALPPTTATPTQPLVASRQTAGTLFIHPARPDSVTFGSATPAKPKEPLWKTILLWPFRMLGKLFEAIGNLFSRKSTTPNANGAGSAGGTGSKGLAQKAQAAGIRRVKALNSIYSDNTELVNTVTRALRRPEMKPALQAVLQRDFDGAITLPGDIDSLLTMDKLVSETRRGVTHTGNQAGTRLNKLLLTLDIASPPTDPFFIELSKVVTDKPRDPSQEHLEDVAFQRQYMLTPAESEKQVKVLEDLASSVLKGKQAAGQPNMYEKLATGFFSTAVRLKENIATIGEDNRSEGVAQPTLHYPTLSMAGLYGVIKQDPDFKRLANLTGALARQVPSGDTTNPLTSEREWLLARELGRALKEQIAHVGSPSAIALNALWSTWPSSATVRTILPDHFQRQLVDARDVCINPLLNQFNALMAPTS